MVEQERERVYPIWAASLDVPAGGWVRVLVNDLDVCEVLSHSDVVFGGELWGQDPLVLPLSYDPLHTEVSIFNDKSLGQAPTHHLCGQILECGDIEGSQNTAEIDSKRVTITCHTTPADDVVVSWGWAGHCRVGSTDSDYD